VYFAGNASHDPESSLLVIVVEHAEN
jgi:hypothetical protein